METAELTNTVPDDVDETVVAEPGQVDAKDDESPPARRRRLVAKIIKTIKRDKAYHKKAFERMERDMNVAMWGAEKSWGEDRYRANIAGRHVQQKTATLYAKNPKASARRAPRLDFEVWDEDPQSLMAASEVLQNYQAVLAAAPPAALDELGAAVFGHNGGPPLEPIIPPEVEQAQAVLADFKQGMERRNLYQRIGRTLEILFAKALEEQQPITFKMAAKQLVRRASTTGVGYVELGFQREYGPRPGVTEGLADAKARLDHMRRLSESVLEGEIQPDDPEMAELEASIASLQQEPEIVIREGLIFDYPRATKVIPDRMCKSIVGFVGARHISIEYEFTVGEIEELFNINLKKCANFSVDGKMTDEIAGVVYDEDGNLVDSEKGGGLVRVWKTYDKTSGLVYYTAEGHDDFLREPTAPDVFVEDFWPVYALTFNEVESEHELFPPSDVSKLLDMQRDHNRSRQGKREHREARRPRWVYPKSIIEETDVEELRKVRPFHMVGLNTDPATDLTKVFQAFPVPGVDPNLYDTNESFADAQLVVGAQEAQLGGTSKASATESAIAADSSNTADGASVDDLDNFMTVVARAASQILLREMSEEKAKEIAGPGAVWPQMSLEEIANELYLEIEAGSMGKPNQAIEIKNWREMLPLLIQLGEISPTWLARETLKRLDDRMDLTDALVSGLPSIASMNQNRQPGAAGAVNDPKAQGAQGHNNQARPPGERPAGSDAPMGDNRS